MGRALLTCVASISLLAIAGCGDKPSKEQCSKLFERLVELSIEEGGADSKALTPEMKEDLERQRAAILESGSEKFISTCTSRTPKRVVECQLGAPNLEEVGKCE